MEKIRERTANILCAVCERYIETGAPVTSSELYDHFKFGIKPAMIRWELNDLSQAGYLFQAHSSAGRVPTDEGYRYYTRWILQELEEGEISDVLNEEDCERISGLVSHDACQELVSEISDRLKLLSVLYDTSEEQIFERGLSVLCARLLSDSSDAVPYVLSDFESIQERLESRSELIRSDDKGVSVYVGESPLMRSPDVSVIMSQVNQGDSTYTLIAVGPKRMDYKKSLSLFKMIL